MSIVVQVLGAPGRDNAVFIRAESGQAVRRFLFDCGEGCLSDLAAAEIQSLDHLLFSHLHMDHVAGFDGFFRRTFNRTTPNMVWGPPNTGQIMHHRFRGFLWNLYKDQSGTWYVHDIYPNCVTTLRFEVNEAFAYAHPVEPQIHQGTIIDTATVTIGALQMDHLTPSIAYILREQPRLNIDTDKLAALGLHPGAWLQRIKSTQPGDNQTIMIDDVLHDLARLRAALLVKTPGESVAYLTDFLMNDDARERLAVALQGCTTVICESQYRHADLALAQRTHHITAVQAAELARQAHVEHLILFHVSDRYRRPEWLDMLREARSIFPNTHFPPHWDLTLDDQRG